MGFHEPPERAIFQMNFIAPCILLALAGIGGAADDATFQAAVRPILKEHCNTCHSTKNQKGDLDLERFVSVAEIKKHPEVWEHVLEQLTNGEMPPKKERQLPVEKKTALLKWVQTTLDEVAISNAGDPGPVVLRRLSNMEYTYTMRDRKGAVVGQQPAHFTRRARPRARRQRRTVAARDCIRRFPRAVSRRALLHEDCPSGRGRHAHAFLSRG